MKKTLNNIIYNGIYQLLILALPIITVPYVARVLGARALGSYSFITSISMFLSFVILMGMNQLGSRIIAVADAYSAMTSDRPYRKAMPTEKALEIITSEVNEKWDADVVNALIQVTK